MKVAPYGTWSRLAKYAFWGAIAYICLAPAYWSDDELDVPAKIFGPAMTVLLIEFISWNIVNSSRKSKSSRAQVKQQELAFSDARDSFLPRVEQQLAQAHGATVGQYHFLDRIGVAVDNQSGRLCFFWPQESYSEIRTRVFEPHQIIDAEIFEDGDSKTRSVTTGSSKTSGGSMVGRAIVGGVLLGAPGLIVGGATAKKNNKSQTVTTTTETVSRIELKITVDDLEGPIYTIPFLENGNVSRGGPLHNQAMEQAKHWYAIVNVLRHRAQ